ncbi:SMP-30/gluconolactonase/LRE family protein [Streptomyces sp. HUAS MG91]|uniref:SMP-30/gluconolactonase/LRE family protein n=1 Tax=Streptomyces tabacisoli TaxID=3156398 RepID=A0AAU8J2D6_9ACTN
MATGEDRQSGLRLVPLGGEGPEHVTGDGTGGLLTGVADGRILGVDPDTGRVHTVADTGGRPLGLLLGRDGDLLVCDAEKGLLRVDLASGKATPLLTTVQGRPLGVCSNVAQDRDGVLYVTDASSRYGLAEWKRDLLEHIGSGRLIRLSPDGTADVLLDGLRFANGVALSPDGSHVVVAETGTRRLHRVWLSGARAGRHDVLTDALPGYPDNLTVTADGLIWVAVAGPPDVLLEAVHRAPAVVRRRAAALPPKLLPDPRPSVRALALDFSGRRIHDVRFPARGFRMVTSAYSADGRLFLGSLRGTFLAVTPLPAGASNGT